MQRRPLAGSGVAPIDKVVAPAAGVVAAKQISHKLRLFSFPPRAGKQNGFGQALSRSNPLSSMLRHCLPNRVAAEQQRLSVADLIPTSELGYSAASTSAFSSAARLTGFVRWQEKPESFVRTRSESIP